jgi:hypothetical protein
MAARTEHGERAGGGDGVRQAWWICAAVALAGCGRGSAPGGGAAATGPDPNRIVEVSTEDIAQGKQKLEELNTPSLEWLLEDLRQRRDVDLAAHDGKPGEDGAYLEGWIEKVAAELNRRTATTATAP